MEYLVLALSLLSLLLHFIAPRTKTTLDDQAAVAVDLIKANLPAAPSVVTVAQTTTATASK